MRNEILFQLEKASFGDVIEREVVTAGVVRVESAIVGTQIGREEEGVRVIVAKQMGGGTMHLAGDEQEVDGKGGGGVGVGEGMVDHGDAAPMVEQHARGEGGTLCAATEKGAACGVAQGGKGEKEGPEPAGFPIVERGGAQGDAGADRIGAEQEGGAVGWQEVNGGAGVGVVDDEAVGGAMMAIVVDQGGDAEQNEGEEREPPAHGEAQLLATIDDKQGSGEQEVGAEGGEQRGVKLKGGEETLREEAERAFEPRQSGGEQRGKERAERGEQEKEETAAEQDVGEGNDEQGGEDSTPG